MTSASLLAIDTSTERMCLALVTGPRVRVHDSDGVARPMPAGAPRDAVPPRAVQPSSGRLEPRPSASLALIPAALALLADAGLELRALDAIAFGRGPGAFTGLRTACSVAQGFAYGAGLPVLSIDSLLIVAEDARAQQDAGDDVWVAMDARMSEVYAARYRHDGQRWQTALAPALYTLDALLARWHAAPPRALAGSALDAFGAARLPSGAAKRITVQRERARALGALARAAWHDGPQLDAAEALPVYLRDKVALTSAERDTAKERSASGEALS